jgi:phthiocerol/phenolphthiocerol synthesis type-I polyketide synthase B
MRWRVSQTEISTRASARTESQMADLTDRLLNQPAGKLALLGAHLRATPHQSFTSEPLAIIGLGCRLPSASTPDEYWHMLVSGRDGITEIPRARWDVDAYYDPDPQTPGKSYSKWGGFLDKVDEFDAAFFGISPREALHMDPRQRILLETTWEALENAGQAPDHLAGTDTGVFIGHMVGDYYGLEAGNLSGTDAYAGTGTLDSILANRLSYVLNLQGPSLAVDSACSSALVALHLACQSLRQGECGMAIAGGVNLILSPEMHVMGAKALLLSPDGRCKTFDRRADGFVRGEGCGIVIVKRLADALAASDNILAVIRGIAVNQDGRTNGISAPNGLSQQRVIRRALQNALLEPSRVTYVETHGTGTAVGDAIEFEALADVYGRTSPEGPCYLGAVKTNIGHLEGAAGIAGVIKMVLCLQQRCIPRNLNFRDINPHVALEPTRLRLPLEVLPWSMATGPRAGAVSSFGLGGTNGHVILEEAPAVTVRPSVERPLHLVTLSGKDERAVRELAQRYDAFLQKHGAVSLPDLAFTANAGRCHFSHRAGIMAGNVDELRAGLGRIRGIGTREPVPQVAFLFSGDAGEGVTGGRELYDTQPQFRRAVDECRRAGAGAESELFVLEYALAELWRSWGVRPAMVLGDGVGRWVAACVDGSLSLEEGLGRAAAGRDVVAEPLATRVLRLHEQGCNVFLEIGPRPILIDIGRQIVGDPATLWLPSLEPPRSEWHRLLESLAQLYERGVAVDWAGFDRDYARRKMALPTYPFRRQRYWLSESPRPARHDGPPMPAPAAWVHRLEWRPQPRLAVAPHGDPGDWLIIEEGKGLGGNLAERLGGFGQRAVVGGDPRRAPSGQYRGVVYLCGDRDAPDVSSRAEALSVGLLHLVQGLTRYAVAPRLWVVTQGSQAVTGAETICVDQAPLWGLARSVRLEHPELQCVSVDLPDEASCLDDLVAEMLSPGESQVAYREGGRYVARLVRDPGEQAPRTPSIQKDGSYVITGGLGALGLEVARHLVDQGARHLVLAGRTGRLEESILEELSGRGASVRVVAADVGRPEDVATLIEAAQVMGPLRGIVHAAGVLDDGILANQTPERFAAVLTPKVRGGWNLHHQTQGLALDFFVCFSSMASLLGASGQGNYAAANAFLDALAHHRRARGLAGLSINWGPWAEVGMAARLRSRLQAHGERLMDPGFGVRMLMRAIGHGPAQLGIMQVDWAEYAQTYPAPEYLERLLDRSVESISTAPPVSTLMQRLRSAPADGRRELLEDFVQAQAALVLGHPQAAVPRRQGFADLGMDSLGSLDLRTRLERALECRLPTTIAFDHPNVEALSAHLMGEVLQTTFRDTPAEERADPAVGSDLEHLTREEIAALLARELSSAENDPSP